MDRSALATVKGAMPEQFVRITVGDGLDIKRMVFMGSARQVRRIYKRNGVPKTEIDSILRKAREHRV